MGFMFFIGSDVPQLFVLLARHNFHFVVGVSKLQAFKLIFFGNLKVYKEMPVKLSAANNYP